MRQGWGYNEGQDLRNLTVDEGARRNLPMFNKVKKGDILLIPQLPVWGEVAIVEATEDWAKGYRYQISAEYKDYGHIFPARFIKSFTRYNENISGNIRSTLKNFSRFWNINHYAEDVEKILNIDFKQLKDRQTYGDRFENSVESVFNETFDEKLFKAQLYEKITNQFTREEWEYALVYGLRKLFPFYNIERVGGTSEIYHGTDILMKLPGMVSNYEYAIAIQVKDFEGYVDGAVLHQIDKAEYWNSENLKLIDKVVILTKADKRQHPALMDNDKGVKFIFAKELEDILSEIGRKIIGIKE